MTPRTIVVTRIPVGVPLLLVLMGFVLVYTGITVLQALGGIALMSALGIAIFGPTKRIEVQEPRERATHPSRTSGDTNGEGSVDRNGHLRVTNETRLVVTGTPRDAETSRRRARRKREALAHASSAGATSQHHDEPR